MGLHHAALVLAAAFGQDFIYPASNSLRAVWFSFSFHVFHHLVLFLLCSLFFLEARELLAKVVFSSFSSLFLRGVFWLIKDAWSSAALIDVGLQEACVHSDLSGGRVGWGGVGCGVGGGASGL